MKLRHGQCWFEVSMLHCGETLCTGVVRSIDGRQLPHQDHVRVGDTVTFERCHVFAVTQGSRT